MVQSDDRALSSREHKRGVDVNLAFRCYAYGSDGSWEAICVDLDIAVFGASFQEVEVSLDTCIQMYLEWVAELPEKEQPRFLTRRSPWYVRAKLALMTWLYGLRVGAPCQGFTLQSHAPALP